jgi:predicted RNase H-like HicB family nuclease
VAEERCEMRQVVVYPGESGYWLAERSSLPGCVARGRTQEEAVANIGEPIEVYIEALEEDGWPVPLVGTLGFRGGSAK